MKEFWESAYRDHAKMWGEDPTDNARNVLELFQRNNMKSVLIPGFGYGRNAKVFYDKGLSVSGIEISKTAIARARRYFGTDVTIHHGSVTNMPFDSAYFESVYCYSLIHLLALSTNDKRFGKGKEVTKNTFRSSQGLTLYFYDETAVKEEFGKYNINELKEIKEPEDDPNEIHWMVVCRK